MRVLFERFDSDSQCVIDAHHVQVFDRAAVEDNFADLPDQAQAILTVKAEGVSLSVDSQEITAESEGEHVPLIDYCSALERLEEALATGFADFRDLCLTE